VGSYRDIQEALDHLYMTAAHTSPCGGRQCLELDYVEIVLDDLGYSGYLGARTHTLRVSLDVRQGPFNLPPRLTFASARSMALAPGQPLLLAGIGVADSDVHVARWDKVVDEGDMLLHLKLTTNTNCRNSSVPHSKASFSVLGLGAVTWGSGPRGIAAGGNEVLVTEGGLVNSTVLTLQVELVWMCIYYYVHAHTSVTLFPSLECVQACMHAYVLCMYYMYKFTLTSLFLSLSAPPPLLLLALIKI
jgi:hypothetical protein